MAKGFTGIFRLGAFRRNLPAEVREEIRSYLEERAGEFQEQGLSADEAWKAALDAFGDVERIETEVEAIDRTKEGMMLGRERGARLVQDLTYAVRGLRRSPGFTVVALLTLALGLGANTAMYSLVRASLFRAPAVENPDELVAVYTTSRRGFPRSATSYPDFLDYRDRSTSLEDLAGTSRLPASLGDDARGARFISIETVTGNYFRLLGVGSSLGRIIGPEDDRRGGAESALVLSHALWRDHFAADPGVVGSSVRLNGSSFTIVGVASADFQGLTLDFRPDAWIPMQSGSRLGVGSISQETVWDSRSSRWMGMSVGRLGEGATIDQLRAELLALSDQLRQEDPDSRGPRSITIDPLSSLLLPNGSEEQMAGFVWLLLGVVGFTLLLTCANLANLLLARGAARTREVAVRLALGAGRGRLIRQLLTEHLTLAVIGGALGIVVAVGLLEVLGRFQLPGGVTIESLGITIDASLLLFTLGVATLTGLLFGLAPALNASHPDLVNSLKGEVTRSARGNSRIRSTLVAVQVGLCLVLLVGSGLFLRTIRSGLTVGLGFDANDIALARFNLDLVNYEPPEIMRFISELEARLEARPDVEVVSVGSRMPLQSGGATGFFAEVPGYERAPDEEIRVDLVFVTPGYFQSLGLPMLVGRPFGSGDVEGGTEVIVISRSMADKYWPGESPVGRTIQLSGNELQVVGVAENATWNGLADEPTNYVYHPLSQSPDFSARFLMLAARTTGDPENLLPVLRAEIHALETDVPLTVLTTMRDQVRSQLKPQQMGAVLLSAFGLLALILATVGIAGVVNYSVSQRSREFGIRMALGAARSSVLALAARGMMVPVLSGLALGIVTASLLSRSVERFLFGVDANDPATYAAVAVLLAGMAMAAAIFPARKATRVDPVEVLKSE